MKVFGVQKCRRAGSKAGEKAAFWLLLGLAAGVGTIMVAARWLKKEEQPAPPARRPVKRAEPARPAPSARRAGEPLAAAVAEEPAPAVTETRLPRRLRGATRPSAGDDLTKIEGIGPKISGWLTEAGLTTYAQLAAASPEQISQILQAAGHRLARPDTWPEQAALAAASRWDELAALQATLKGGRRVS